jgi:hypothetical protein
MVPAVVVLAVKGPKRVPEACDLSIRSSHRGRKRLTGSVRTAGEVLPGS